jgi:3-methyl-2-oxobutanoate hydroxymethyltransferase
MSTIGIGSGPYCDGKAVVTQDMLSLYKEMQPRFLEVYADISKPIIGALTEFRQEEESGRFLAPEHSYGIDEVEPKKLLSQLRSGQRY